MHVGAAVRFFFDQTTAGLELGVHLKLLPKEALKTAWFLRLISAWFELVSSRLQKTSITTRNKEKKLECLRKFIDIMQGLRIVSSWKPLNTGMILGSQSLSDISDMLLKKDGFEFLLLH